MSSSKKRSGSGGPGGSGGGQRAGHGTAAHAHDGDGIIKGSGVNYQAILDHRIDDTRHERQKAYKAKEMEEGLSFSNSLAKKTVSATFDAFQRMATGKKGRLIADKLADPNRPTWEEYKKVNEDKLDMVGQEIRKMTEYRAELDKERDQKLAARREKKRKLYSDSEDSDGEEEDSEERSDGTTTSSDDERGKKKKKKEKKSKKVKKKKEKKSKKKRKKRSNHTSSGSDDGHGERESAQRNEKAEDDDRGNERDDWRSEEEEGYSVRRGRERSRSPALSIESGEVVEE